MNSNLSATQKIILAITAIMLLLSIVYPPFYIEASGQTRNVGYSLIFDPPYGRAVVNLAQVALQSASILAIGAICFLLAKK